MKPGSGPADEGRVWVKICGVRRQADVRAAAEAGADAVGFNFWPSSPRFVPPDEAAALARGISGSMMKVGVFVDAPAAQVSTIAGQVGLDAVQLHGDEPPAAVDALLAERRWVVVKAVRGEAEFRKAGLGERRDVWVLVDGAGKRPGGTGVLGDWRWAATLASRRRVILAGGLSPDNVAEAVATVRPWGVDVAGGVEAAPGVKDPDRVRAFVRAARRGAGLFGSPR